jgi:hypothetical protein
LEHSIKYTNFSPFLQSQIRFAPVELQRGSDSQDGLSNSRYQPVKYSTGLFSFSIAAHLWAAQITPLRTTKIAVELAGAQKPLVLLGKTLYILV